MAPIAGGIASSHLGVRNIEWLERGVMVGIELHYFLVDDRIGVT